MVFLDIDYTASLDPYVKKAKVELVRVLSEALSSGGELL